MRFWEFAQREPLLELNQRVTEILVKRFAADPRFGNMSESEIRGYLKDWDTLNVQNLVNASGVKHFDIVTADLDKILDWIGTARVKAIQKGRYPMPFSNLPSNKDIVYTKNNTVVKLADSPEKAIEYGVDSPFCISRKQNNAFWNYRSSATDGYPMFYFVFDPSNTSTRHRRAVIHVSENSRDKFQITDDRNIEQRISLAGIKDIYPDIENPERIFKYVPLDPEFFNTDFSSDLKEMSVYDQLKYIIVKLVHDQDQQHIKDGLVGLYARLKPSEITLDTLLRVSPRSEQQYISRFTSPSVKVEYKALTSIDDLKEPFARNSEELKSIVKNSSILVRYIEDFLIPNKLYPNSDLEETIVAEFRRANDRRLGPNTVLYLKYQNTTLNYDEELFEVIAGSVNAVRDYIRLILKSNGRFPDSEFEQALVDQSVGLIGKAAVYISELEEPLEINSPLLEEIVKYRSSTNDSDQLLIKYLRQVHSNGDNLPDAGLESAIADAFSTRSGLLYLDYMFSYGRQPEPASHILEFMTSYNRVEDYVSILEFHGLFPNKILEEHISNSLGYSATRSATKAYISRLDRPLDANSPLLKTIVECPSLTRRYADHLVDPIGSFPNADLENAIMAHENEKTGDVIASGYMPALKKPLGRESALLNFVVKDATYVTQYITEFLLNYKRLMPCLELEQAILKAGNSESALVYLEHLALPNHATSKLLPLIAADSLVVSDYIDIVLLPQQGFPSNYLEKVIIDSKKLSSALEYISNITPEHLLGTSSILLREIAVNEQLMRAYVEQVPSVLGDRNIESILTQALENARTKELAKRSASVYVKHLTASGKPLSNNQLANALK